MKCIGRPLILLIISIGVFIGCKNDKNTKSVIINQENEAKVKPTNVINIVTQAMEFQMVDTIPCGWNTFKYKNLSDEIHFVVFEKYPEGITIDSTRAQVFPVFDKGMDLINEGKNKEGFSAFNSLPAWFFNVEFTGGIGLVSPKETAVSTIKLDPGRYLIECYVKMKNGKFHSVMGMYKEIIVSNTPNDLLEPEATVGVSISSENGIEFKPGITSGKQIFKIAFKDQKVHEHFLGHDVHVVKLDESADLATLNNWMNWSAPTGLLGHGVDGVTFLGGTQEAPAGDTTYFTANLKPGNYALIAEVPDPLSKGMLKTFSVPSN